MDDVVVAARIRAVAFTPGLWVVRRQLSQPATTRRRPNRRHLARVGLTPTLVASAIDCYVTASRDAALGQLRVSGNHQIVATIKDPCATGKGTHTFTIGAQVRAFLPLLAYALLAFVTACGIAWLTRSPSWTLAALVLSLLAFIPALWRYITLHTKRKPFTLQQATDITLEGFARLPTSRQGEASRQLTAWLPPGRPIHGVAFEGLLPIYQSIAAKQGQTIRVDLIGNAWKVGRWILRPALYELRVF